MAAESISASLWTSAEICFVSTTRVTSRNLRSQDMRSAWEWGPLSWDRLGHPPGDNGYPIMAFSRIRELGQRRWDDNPHRRKSCKKSLTIVRQALNVYAHRVTYQRLCLKSGELGTSNQFEWKVCIAPLLRLHATINPRTTTIS